MPAGGLPMMLYGAEKGANIDGAPIVNGITLVAKAAEMAVKLRRLAGMAAVSRRSNYAKPPEKALKEFSADEIRALAASSVRWATQRSIEAAQIVTRH